MTEGALSSDNTFGGTFGQQVRVIVVVEALLARGNVQWNAESDIDLPRFAVANFNRVDRTSLSIDSECLHGVTARRKRRGAGGGVRLPPIGRPDPEQAYTIRRPCPRDSVLPPLPDQPVEIDPDSLPRRSRLGPWDG